MAVQCTNCGEQILGAVNRCWKCGVEFVPHSGPTGQPPVRRSPVKDVAQQPLTAELVDGDCQGEAATASTSERRWARRGSPFGAVDTAPAADTLADATGDAPAVRIPEYPRHMGSFSGAVVAIAMGIISFFLAFFFPVGALIVAIVGLAMGIWGLQSTRRGAAILGLVICCIAFAIAGFNGAVDVYESVHGVSPFETFVPETVDE